MAGNKQVVDTEQSFNDSELEDIMSEIENLEKEFVDESQETISVDDLKISSAEVKENDIQAQIDEEMFVKKKMQSEKTEDQASPLVEESKVSTETLDEEIEEEKATAGASSASSAQERIMKEIEEVSDNESQYQVPQERPVNPHDVADDSGQSNVVSFASKKSPDGHPISKNAQPIQSNETEMHFSVSGHMNLRLSFCVGGQTIGLVVNETDGLAIDLGQGAKFTVPLGVATTQQKRTKVS